MDVTVPTSTTLPELPSVLLLGQGEHADFWEAVDALRASARVTVAASVGHAVAQLSADAAGPELIVLAQSRPGAFRAADVERLRRAAPLAGIAMLAGSWCEGESRTGRPMPGVRRLYWYEFNPWWQRQIARRAIGRCPDWAQPPTVDPIESFSHRPDTAPESRGLVVLQTIRWETADALADLLTRAGHAAVWQPPGRPVSRVWGAAAGIWEGAQLNWREEQDLAKFCRGLGGSAAVVALLDFPRHDAVRRARKAGAMAVLGKPWQNADLLEAVSRTLPRTASDGKSTVSRAA